MILKYFNRAVIIVKVQSPFTNIRIYVKEYNIDSIVKVRMTKKYECLTEYYNKKYYGFC